MRFKKPPKLKKGAWFYKTRGSYLPGTWQAWLTYIPFVGFLVLTVIVAFTTQDTVAGVIFMIFPQWVAAAVVMTWVASQRA
jgi:hypothetical protein